MPQELRAVFTIADDGSVTLKNLSTRAKTVKKDIEQAGVAADKFGDTAASAANDARKGQERLNNSVQRTENYYKQAGAAARGAASAGRTAGLSGTGSGTGIEDIDPDRQSPFPTWTTQALDFAAAGLAAKKAWDGTMSAINLSAMQQVQETTFQALLNSQEAGSALYDYVSAYARTSALGREDIANAVTAYSSYTKDIDQLEQLIKMTERLYAKDPTQGASGAVFAMRELLSGDTMSIKDRFNMSGFSGETIRNLANTGDIEGLLSYVDAQFNKFGATQAVVDANFDNLTTQTNIFASNLQTAIAESATPAMETLSGTMQQLNADMDAGKFQPFINLMSSGMQMIASAAAWAGENLDWLLPIVVGLVSAFVIYKGVTLAAAAGQAIFAAATSLMTGNIIGTVAALLALVGGMTAVAAVSDSVAAQTNADLESVKKQYADIQKGLPETTAGATVPVEVSNTAPISVKGEVEIEEENLKYMLDIQGQKWLAKFSTATLAPQLVFNGTTIEKTADFDEFAQVALDSLQNAVDTTAAGVYT